MTARKRNSGETRDGAPDRWAPVCPDGNPQRLGRILGFRERSVEELELRVDFGSPYQEGTCDVVVDERDDEVWVRVILCHPAPLTPRANAELGIYNVPVRTWLDRPLGERAVIDYDLGTELPLFKPRYLNNVWQPDAGFHVVCRRRRAGALGA